MNNKLTKISILLLIAVSFAIGIIVYPRLPETVASHWNTQGMVDGYMSKFWGIFLMPMFLIFIYALYLIIPKIDPLKNNLESFRKQFNLLILLISIFLFYTFALTIAWNLGMVFDMNNFILPALGIFFYYIGVLIKHAKRNWFVGIRTPWTLSSDYVWDKTHKIGSKLFKIIGVITLLGVFLPNYIFGLFLVLLIGSVLYLFIYSYILFKKENENKLSN
ncbi:hypothetical protein A3I18_00220 [Candidatus Campbellbacteria bacterium RIFCSPLOWO2_02_FULL_35_11]|uniref:DUF1648 domain-containing protein n=2 Tax=Candidatus Campbelliibacteriota TaxID=1752727 RepID=A0A1F5EP94_9BACT|nr:MAG: hypothetical protein A3E89_01175 [Candidatus Campbellbacteria bacterium RIFCSPHIGHO2_12_FULL_35_10]OGD70063.1 MAG: hypothetical protein A3I18_00220 [Candidatus Campbellbacteria bacterium RIFCSPLOWO2_02_FULL_35_11]